MLAVLLFLPYEAGWAIPNPDFTPPAQTITEAIELCKRQIAAAVHGEVNDGKPSRWNNLDPEDYRKFLDDLICVTAEYDYAANFGNRYYMNWGRTDPRNAPVEADDRTFEAKASEYVRKLWPIMKDNSLSWFITLIHPRQTDLSFTFRVMRNGNVYKLVETHRY